MLATIWSFICSMFGANSVGKLIKTIFANASKQIATEVLDKKNQQKAYEFVKELHMNKDMSNSEKAAAFNKKFLEWSLKTLKKSLSLNVVNCLRELAVTAVKIEEEQTTEEN